MMLWDERVAEVMPGWTEVEAGVVMIKEPVKEGKFKQGKLTSKNVSYVGVWGRKRGVKLYHMSELRDTAWV